MFAAALGMAMLAGCGPTIPGPDTDPAALDRLESRFVAYDGPVDGRIRAIFAGDPEGRRLIFVHGTPGGAEGWADFLADPLPGFETVAVDRPGNGRSEPRGAVPALKAQAAALEPLLVAREGRWPILIGHSLGAPVVARLAADNPDRVGGLVLVAGALDPDLEEIHPLQYVGEWWPIRHLIGRTWRVANRELLGLEAGLRRLEPSLPRITAPVAIVHGTEDSLVPYANVAYMERHLSGADALVLIPLEAEDHFLPWVAETAIRAAIARVAALASPR